MAVQSRGMGGGGGRGAKWVRFVIDLRKFGRAVVGKGFVSAILRVTGAVGKRVRSFIFVDGEVHRQSRWRVEDFCGRQCSRQRKGNRLVRRSFTVDIEVPTRPGR